MKIIFFLFIMVIAILLIGKRVFRSAKRILFKDEAAWSGKDIKIKYNDSSKVSESEGKDSFLKMIADESKIYLDAQSKNEGK